MKIAIEGCAHGELEKIYECIEALQQSENIKIDLLICCGDFQAVRNKNDLRAMAVPEKYQNICTFYKYYSGEKQAPLLTIFIGGNHEASNYLQELPYGGWVAPKIYYLGRAGVVKFGNLRIGGLSGIYKGRDYLQGLWECPPYTPSSMRSVYHIRSLDVFRLSQLKDKIHVMLTHDWPRGITQYGDRNNLLKRKPFLRDDIESNQLGSAPAENLLHLLKPEYWFAAHLHCQFAAIVKHEADSVTKFLALDKCLPKRRHLQILDLPQEYDGDKVLRYDEEWLAILKSTNHLMTVKNMDCHMPGPGCNERYDFTPTPEEKYAVEKLMKNMTIKDDSFVQTAPVYTPDSPRGQLTDPILNSQTVNLCEKLGIDDPLQVLMARLGRVMKQQTQNQSIIIQSPELKTPIKSSKLSLPAPVTPSENVDNFSLSNSLLSCENTSFVSDSSNCNTIVQCITPISSGSKKAFKRRNHSLYTLDDDDSSTTSSSLESPRSNKLPYVTECSDR